VKPPGWLKSIGPSKGVLSADGKAVVFTFRVRWWHPGYWLARWRYRR
jgi:hypothetical protein